VVACLPQSTSEKNESNLLLVWITVCVRTNRDLFTPNRVLKTRESQQLFVGLRFVSRIFEEFQHPAIQTKIVQHFDGFFSSNKSAPANRKKGFYTKRDPNKQEVGFIFV
jgi:hypothetical protein